MLEQLLDRLTINPRTRIVAFGSSNTERRLAGLHWFDWLELGIKHAYGRVHHCINAGLGGDTTRGLLGRFDEDVALYQRHAVLVTIGGNDSGPQFGISDGEYRDNLVQICALIRGLGAEVILQTYYSADIERMEPEYGAAFQRYMGLVRKVATSEGTALIDHHRRWERLRKQDPQTYRSLMVDALHVNALGNAVIGLDLVRAFRGALPEAQPGVHAEGLRLQEMLDRMERAPDC